MIDFIQKCGNNGMVLNPEKFKFGVTETDFAGFWVGNGVVKPMESHVDTIRNFEELRKARRSPWLDQHFAHQQSPDM